MTDPDDDNLDNAQKAIGLENPKIILREGSHLPNRRNTDCYPNGVLPTEARIATIKDLYAITELDKTFDASFLPFTRSQFKHLILSPTAEAFLMYFQKELIGSGAVLISRLRNKTTKGRIYSVGVIKKYQGQKLGNKLMEVMEKYLWDKGVSYITLETHLHHDKVIKFYERRGYYKTEELPEYYEPEDGIRMRLDK